jgi:hypothetical protein
MHRKGPGTVNSHFHDHFVELVALFYSGELSDEEWALLQVHMAYCDSCRLTFEQYEQIVAKVIPVMAASAAEESGSTFYESEEDFEEARRVLMASLEDSSRKAEPAKARKTYRAGWAAAIAACVIVVVSFAATRFVHKRYREQARTSLHPVIQPPQPPKATSHVAQAQQALDQDQKAVTRLQGDLKAAQRQSKDSESLVAEVQKQLLSEQVQQQQAIAQRDVLATQLEASQATIQTLQTKAGISDANAGQQVTRLSSLETQVRQLSGSLDDANSTIQNRDRMLALDKDFLDHDRDIRNVIGARNLYIADIFDTTQDGRTAKPFGRLFYTKDRSLVLYGFDLDKQSGLKQDVSFQVWGGSTDKPPVSLGLFYQDDSHQRWVLRCDDPASLARLNMVFVTVEPPGGSRKPTGKRMLRAFLQIHPNHL